ncbi:alpha/beta hydrolase [Streptomyces nodosus]
MSTASPQPSRYALDPELADAFSAPRPAVARGDWAKLRELGTAGQAYMATLDPASTGVTRTRYSTPAADGAALELRWYRPRDATPGPAVLYVHGGGMVLGSLDAYDRLLGWYAEQSRVPFLSVGYRPAPESTGTALAEDVYAGLRWLNQHAPELDIDPHRIAVMADSGGGAPAAGATLLARERGTPIARQILIYPMLDDRTVNPDPALDAVAPWTYDNNATAWGAVLGNRAGTDRVSPVEAPARLTDATALPSAYLETGDLDIFRTEVIRYAATLAVGGVPVELHVHPGAPHGFDRLAPDATVTRRAHRDRLRVIATL